jgi:hypothetical protein
MKDYHRLIGPWTLSKFKSDDGSSLYMRNYLDGNKLYSNILVKEIDKDWYDGLYKMGGYTFLTQEEYDKYRVLI